jgi:hypothetical protein
MTAMVGASRRACESFGPFTRNDSNDPNDPNDSNG